MTDTEATALFNKHIIPWLPGIRSKAGRCCRSKRSIEADDVVQEVLMVAYKHIKRGLLDLSDKRRLWGWLDTVTRNEFLRQVAYRGPRPWIDGSLEININSPPADTSDYLAGTAINMDRQTLLECLSDEAVQAIGRLSSKGREAVMLRLQGYTNREVGKMLNCGETAAQSRAVRAHKHLRPWLLKYAYGIGWTRTGSYNYGLRAGGQDSFAHTATVRVN